MDIQTEKRQEDKSPSAYDLNKSPNCVILSLSPTHNGSSLYDSFELQAVTKQLNRAIQGSNAALSPYSSYLKSPFYCLHLHRIHRNNAKTRNKILGSDSDGKPPGIQASARGVVWRLWKKVKHGFMRSKV